MQQKRPHLNPLILALALAAVLMIWSVFTTSNTPSGTTMSYSTVVHYFEHLQVTAFTLDRNTGVITMNIKEGDLPLPEGAGESAAQSGGLMSGLLGSGSSSADEVQANSDGTVTVRYQLPYAALFINEVQKYIDAYDAANPDAPMEYDYTALRDTVPWMEIFFYLAMLGCTGFILFSMLRGGAGGGNVMNVGRAKVKDESANQKTATFADVAGEDEEKEELKEVVEFLKSPEKFNSLGARIPHGVLLVGPPGTGKTLLARACAGEAGVPFYSISGSDFVEMYVGVGASRVRDLFDKAKKTMPCIIFIDEIDTIGKKRDGQFSGNDEREQTLNQLLTEMDGFDGSKGVVVLAATNRPDSLDPALLRPGRFDRRIPVELPDLQGRIDILKVHAKKIRLAEDVDFEPIAKTAAGASGAELANIVNEAALRAVRAGRQYATQEDLQESVEVVIAGYQKKSRVLSDEEKKIVAYHETGHALVAAMQTHSAPVQKITIIPRTSGALGYTLQVDDGDHFLMSKDELLNKIATYTGGRAAEELVFHSVTTGASNDIEQATKLARSMISRFGMSDEFGFVAFETVSNQYLGGDASLACSPETQARMDQKVTQLVEEQHQKALNILKENEGKLHELADYLYQHETITGQEFMDILERKALPEQE